ncbi:PaaI family thioesterase [Arhodomonas sp. SL1]|uniref:PaaI family thioesterase n=1 Tax=Arhodomonas sp. SL1 TaxID=3425691 RepID=UPI003F882D55
MGQQGDDAQRLATARRFFDTIPHSTVLGMEPVAVGEGCLTARVPYRPELVGNPVTGVIHGGVITTLVDQTSGGAVIAALDRPQAVATLDLRIDYMRPAEPGEVVYAHAECYKVTSQIAFARCTVYQQDFRDPIAMSMSTFMRAAEGEPNLTEGAG